MGFDHQLAFKAASSEKGSIYRFAHDAQLEQIKTNEMMANEYYDFIEFLHNELGDEYKELRRKFEIESFGEALTYDEDLELIEL